MFFTFGGASNGSDHADYHSCWDTWRPPLPNLTSTSDSGSIVIQPWDEEVFLDDRGITVTSSRFVVPGHSYFMSEITVVASQMTSRKWMGAALCGLLAMLALTYAIANRDGVMCLSAFVFAGIAVALWKNGAPGYHLLLHTATSEIRALTTTEESWIDSIIGALNEAMIYRLTAAVANPIAAAATDEGAMIHAVPRH
jgi:hypothetical protein